MKNIFLIILLGVFFISSVSAVEQELGTFSQDKAVELIQICDNCTFNNVSYIKLPNSTIIKFNEAMTKDSTFYNYTLGSTFTDLLGEYIVNGVGDDDGTNDVWSYSFYITKTGVQLSQDKAMVYLGMMFLFVFLFIVNVVVITRLPSSNQVDEENEILSISRLKYLKLVLIPTAYILLMALIFVSSNISFLYLETTLVGDLLFKMFLVMGKLILPILFVWVGWLIYLFWRDMELRRLIERGFVGGSI